MRGDVTIITPAVELRFGALLNEALESVRAQTVQPVAHFIGVDYARRDNARIQNELVEGVTTEWVMLLADDDVLYPTHLERCLEAARPGVDVVYTYADMSMWPSLSPQRRFINAPWDPVRIQHENWIPGGCALIRTEAWRRVGGCSEDPANYHIHDWVMWKQIAATGGEFVCIPEVLWLYRHHAGQKEAMHGKPDREAILRRAGQ